MKASDDGGIRKKVQEFSKIKGKRESEKKEERGRTKNWMFFITFDVNITLFVYKVNDEVTPVRVFVSNLKENKEYLIKKGLN